MFKSIIFAIVLGVIIFSAGSTVSAVERKIIATYYDSWQPSPPPGWRQLTNSKGAIGDDANYTFLDRYKNNSKHWYWGTNYYTDATGAVRGGTRNSTLPPKINGRKQYAIAAYSLQKEYDEDLWLTNGNLQCRGGRSVELKVYLNNKLKLEHVVKLARQPYLFQCEFGKLKKGDVIYVALASSKRKSANGRLLFTLESFPNGKRPDNPVNIISPRPTEATPKLLHDGRPDPKYIKTHKKSCENLLAIKPNLVFIGDSITARWDPLFLDEKFGKYKPGKFGYGGDWMQNTLWRVANGPFGTIKPKVVVLLIGTNNVAHKFTDADITAGVKAIIASLKTQTPNTKIIIMGIFPRGAIWNLKQNRYYKIIKTINANLAKIADCDEKITFLDIGEKLVEPDGSITKEMMKDKLHIGAKGFEIWADALIPVLRKINE